ncbi:hypothetical protein ACDX78_13300 [Virgibacillus oceani]
MMFFWVPIVGLLIIAFFDFLFHRKNKESRLSMKGYFVLFIFFVVFFTWLLPLGQKYYYVQRVDLVEEIFAARETGSVSTDGDIMIGLVKSEYDPLIRPPFRSITYTNYFYIKNNGNTSYEGDIYLLLYDENNEPIDIKLLEDVKADPNGIRLLVENEDKTITDEWSESSFGTKQQVKSFEAVVGEK